MVILIFVGVGWYDRNYWWKLVSSALCSLCCFAILHHVDDLGISVLLHIFDHDNCWCILVDCNAMID